MNAKSTTKSGFLYVLVHPSDPTLHKIGQTTRHPLERLIEHNTNYAEHAGRIVRETGQKWELKTYFAVPDPIWAESVFWGATGLKEIPARGGIEVEQMEWNLVQAGLTAAEKAGVRPPPNPLPDYVYVYTAWMKKRLEGRGITIVGHVKSKRSGRNNFRCDNGHEWRSTPKSVADGEGCPMCGTGQMTAEQTSQAEQSGVLCLLIHPKQPGLVKIGLTQKTLEQCFSENVWGEWEVHRYRNVEEPALAETLIWELLGHPLPNDRAPISIDLRIAEQAFREIHYRLQSKIAYRLTKA
jgi:hypothetical protein